MHAHTHAHTHTDTQTHSHTYTHKRAAHNAKGWNWMKSMHSIHRQQELVLATRCSEARQNRRKWEGVTDLWTDRRMDGPKDGWADRPSYRVECPLRRNEMEYQDCHRSGFAFHHPVSKWHHETPPRSVSPFPERFFYLIVQIELKCILNYQKSILFMF